MREWRGALGAVVVVTAGVLTVGVAVSPTSKSRLSVGAASPTSTVAAAATTTTIAAHRCVAPPGLLREIHQPTTLTLTTANNYTTYSAPVGTVFVVSLAGGGVCDGPYWSAPQFGPAGVIRAINGTDITVGAHAGGTFEIVGTGHASITFPGQCGPITSGCVPGDWLVSVGAVAAETTTTTTVLPKALPKTT